MSTIQECLRLDCGGGACDKRSRPIRFVVLGDARTGTTMLRHLLDQHPDVSCAGELISNDVDTVFGGSRGARMLPFKRRLLRSSSFKRARVRQYFRSVPRARAVGFKALYEQVTPAMRGFLEQRLDRVMLIVREDRVRRALSLMQAEDTDCWNIVHSRSETPPSKYPYTADFERLTRLIGLSEACDREWTAWVNALGPRGLVMQYEELVQDRVGNLGTALEFLGLEPASAASLTPETVRLTTPKPLSEVLLNYDDLLAAAAGTRWAELLTRFEHPLV